MNSIIPLSSTPLTMSSREIAEMTFKDHAHICRDIRNLLKELENPDLDSLFKSSTYTDLQGIERTQFDCSKEGTLLLISGYSAELRWRIIRRWQELEAGIAQSFDLAVMTSAALRELAAKVEEITTLNTRIITMQPKADFYDHVAGSEALFDRADAAKILRTGPRRLWTALREWKIVQANGMPYQKYFDQGFFRLVPVLVHKGEYSIPFQQTMVTSKGLIWLKALMDSQVMPGKAIATPRGA